MDYYAIGQRIRKIRKANSLSQEQLAERVGISVTHMSHIETGNTKLSLEVFSEIAQSLDARADELLFGEREIIREQASEDILALLSECNPKQLCIISDILRAAKTSLEKYC
ncbi:MAG: helix-turn-helix domain-containing protein [Oscillospiraceae bacterium]